LENNAKLRLGKIHTQKMEKALYLFELAGTDQVKGSRKKLKGHSIPFFKHVLLATV